MAVNKTISKEALAVLASMEVEGNAARFDKYHQLGGPGQLDRKLYEECNKALEAIGGNWNRGKKAHLFADDPRDALDQAVLTGAFTDAKQEFQHFVTPAVLADRIVSSATIKSGMRVLEPSAGDGAIVEAARRAGIGDDCLTIVELNPKRAEKLARFEALGALVWCGDFLEFDTSEPFDFIPMNPPFSRQQDIAHVTRAFSLLRSGGRLVSVMSPGFTYRKDKKATEFRALVDRCGGEVEDLPAETFKSSGTNVNTVLVTLDRE